MSIHITISKDNLKILKKCLSKDPTRYALMNYFIDEKHIYATNGRIACKIKHNNTNIEKPTACGIFQETKKTSNKIELHLIPSETRYPDIYPFFKPDSMKVISKKGHIISKKDSLGLTVLIANIFRKTKKLLNYELVLLLDSLNKWTVKQNRNAINFESNDIEVIIMPLAFNLKNESTL